MDKKTLPSPEALRQLLRYEPETGRLFWEMRGVEWFSSHNSCAIWNSKYAGKEALYGIDRSGYRKGSLLNVRCYAHRAAWAISYGEWPPFHVDHINMVRSDNRLCNLRSATHAENQWNKPVRTDNASGFTGVSWSAQKGKWHARIHVNSKGHHLGFFDTAEDAAKSYEVAASRMHGLFARTA